MFRLMILLLAITMIPDAGCEKSDRGQKPPETKEPQGKEADKTMERVGPGWAVEGYEPTGRIKLSEKAVKRLGLTPDKVSIYEGVVRIDIEAVVEDNGQSFVYVQEPNGWMKRVPVKTGPRSVSQIQILSGVEPGTVYVAKGAALVRLAELDLVSGEEAE